MSEKKSVNGLCIAGFVMSIVTFFVLGFYGLGPLASVIVSATGRKKAKARGQNTIFGTLGMIIGIVSLIICLIMLLKGYSLDPDAIVNQSF
ncbi:MAG: hypothetical protein CW338_08610 [Clostridiales bacterium]|nr:hypothetical protein [Clostridiales bacterium]